MIGCCCHTGMFSTSVNGRFETHVKGCECFWRECLAEGQRWEWKVIVDIVVVTVIVAIHMNVVVVVVAVVVVVVVIIIIVVSSKVKWW